MQKLMWGAIKKETGRTALKRQQKNSSERIPSMESRVLAWRWGRNCALGRQELLCCWQRRKGRKNCRALCGSGGTKKGPKSRNSRWQHLWGLNLSRNSGRSLVKDSGKMIQISVSCLFSHESQDHGRVWVGRDIKDHPVPHKDTSQV